MIIVNITLLHNAAENGCAIVLVGKQESHL